MCAVLGGQNFALPCASSPGWQARRFVKGATLLAGVGHKGGNKRGAAGVVSGELGQRLQG